MGMGRARAGAALCAAALTVNACASADQEPPRSGKVKIDFPSITTAIQTETLEIYVFEETDAPNLCFSLREARRTQRAWPQPPLAQSAQFAPCDLLAEGAVALPPVPFGERVLLVVGKTGGQDVLIGCARATVDGKDLPAPIGLTTPGSTTSLGIGGSCTSLRQFCEKKCAP